MKPLTTTTILSFFILLLMLPAVMSDPDQYLMAGVDRMSSHAQSGTGNWAGREAVTYSRVSATGINSFYPIVGDVDNDTIDELVVLEGDQLVIYNFTTGAGLVTEASLDHGNTSIKTTKFYITPALIDIDSDGDLDIISSNLTHMLTYSWNGTHYYLNQSSNTSIGTTNAPWTSNKYPSIKCAAGNQWASGNTTCVMPVNSRSKATQTMYNIVYDVDANRVFYENATALAVDNARVRNTHLYDGDGDGKLEAYYSYIDDANGKNYVYVLDVDSSNSITKTLLYLQDEAANTPYSDIIVNKLNGVTPSITWTYSANKQDYNAITIKASDGSVLVSSYCSTTCPEGNLVSVNMWEAQYNGATMPSPYMEASSNDVCAYIRNYDKNPILTSQDPNEDAITCFSSFGGAGFKNTFVSNTANFTSHLVVHQAALHGTQGLLTPAFTVQGSTKQSLPTLPDSGACIPVDMQKTGSMDIICMNATILNYLDDSYTNQNVNIDTISPDTGNSICNGETLTTTLTISDEENNAGYCYLRAVYANQSSVSNSSLVAFAAGQTSLNLYFTATVSVPTNYIHYYECRDVYHTVYDSFAYSVSYSNNTCGSGLCNCKGYGTPIPIDETPEPEEGSSQDEIIEEVLDPLLGTGPLLKLIAGIAIIIAIIIAVAEYTKNGFVLGFTALAATILVTALGLINAYLLVVLLISLVLLIILGKMLGGGGHGNG